jgi:hypothetical protein
MPFGTRPRCLVQVGPEAPVGGDPVSSFSISGFTYTLSSPKPIVRHADCDGNAVVCIVSSDPVTVTSNIAKVVEGGRTKNGAMKNPKIWNGTTSSAARQGFDSASPQFLDSLSLNAAAGVSLSPGDILVTVKSRDSFGGIRNGVTDEQAAVYVRTTAPDPTSLAPAVIGWNSRGTPAPTGAIDWEAKAAALPTYAYSGPIKIDEAWRNVTRTVSQMMFDLRFNIGPALSPSETTHISYEYFTPYLWSTNRMSNYGEAIAQGSLSSGLIALISNILTTSEKATLLKAFASFGKQCYDTWKGSGNGSGGNGGHNTYSQGPIAVYLWVTGQESLMDSIIADTGGGNYAQAFVMTSGQAALLTPHDGSGNNPHPWRRRTVDEVSGNTVWVPIFGAFGGADPSRGNFRDMVLVRESDGATALISNITNSHGTDPTQWGSGSSANPSQRLGLQINAQPGTPFAVSDVVYVRPNWTTPTAGWVDWAINGTAGTNFRFYNPGARMPYREVQRVDAHLLFMRALGLLSTDYEPMWNLITLTHSANHPASVDDWATNFSNPWCQTFWNTHLTALSSVEQRFGA